MNKENLINILKEKKLYIRTHSDKNIISICPICGDHPNPRKKGHLYISLDPSKPIYHCFYGNCVGTIRKLMLELTGSHKITDSVITKKEISENIKKSKIVKKTTNKTNIKIPELSLESFPTKTEYIKKRINTNIINIDLFKNNLIFDLKHFIKINPNIKTFQNEDPSFVDKLHNKFIGFMGNNQSLLIFRNIDNNDYFKFKKYIIQEYKYNLMDYIKFNGLNKDSNLIVLSEGVFDILGLLSCNILNLFKSAKLFASGQSFSYESLLKSVCFDESLYSKVDVIILSDSDKNYYCYNKFIKNTKHIVNSLKIYYNKNKKDFGTFPIEPIQYIN